MSRTSCGLALYILDIYLDRIKIVKGYLKIKIYSVQKFKKCVYFIDIDPEWG